MVLRHVCLFRVINKQLTYSPAYFFPFYVLHLLFAEKEYVRMEGVSIHTNRGKDEV